MHFIVLSERSDGDRMDQNLVGPISFLKGLACLPKKKKVPIPTPTGLNPFEGRKVSRFGVRRSQRATGDSVV